MRRLFKRISAEARLKITLCVLFVALVVGYLAPNIFISVPAGHVGVLWSRLFGGTITTKVYNEGLHAFLPWDHVTLYDVREQRLSQQFDSVTSDGVHVMITMDVRYHLIINQLGVLQRNLGSDYVNTLIAPNVSAFLRQQVARYTTEEVYSTQRSYIERVVLDYMRLNRSVILRASTEGLQFANYDSVFINGVVLPPAMQAAIALKMAQREAVHEWSYRVQREQLESQRREIEAEGTRKVLAILGEKLSDTFVRLRYVEMLGTLAQGNGTKLIITAPGGVGPGLVVGADTPITASSPPSGGPRQIGPSLTLPIPPEIPTILPLPHIPDLLTPHSMPQTP